MYVYRRPYTISYYSFVYESTLHNNAKQTISLGFWDDLFVLVMPISNNAKAKFTATAYYEDSSSEDSVITDGNNKRVTIIV